MILKRFIIEQLNWGTSFTNNIITQKNIQKANFFNYSYCIFLFLIAGLNFFNDNKSFALVEYRDLFILLVNFFIFRVYKNIKLYLYGLSIIFTFMLCESLIFGGFHGTGLIGVGIFIIVVMNIAGIKLGSILSVTVLLIDIFVCLFNNNIEWIYSYPETFEILYIRFIAAHIGVFAFTFISLKKYNELFRQVNKDKEDRKKFFINIVHDLKTPITLINNNIDRIIKDRDDTESVEILKANILKMETNILNILNHNRLENGTYKNEKKVTNVSELTYEFCEIFKGYAESMDKVLEVNITDDLFIEIDKTSFIEIISNLLDNAIKYTSSKGTVAASLYLETGKVTLSVKDNGIGISESERESIFNPYYQGNEGFGNYYGAGSGLAIVDEICKVFNGVITLESNLNSGSTFFVSFPQKKNLSIKNNRSLNIKYSPISREVKIRNRNNGSKTLLIVEDNVDIRNLLVENFRDEYNLMLANNGKEALLICSEYSGYDLIISDIMMPIMDGYEFVKQLRKKANGLNVPVIFLTAKSNKEDAEQCLSLGAVDYISKPFLVNELRIKVDSILKLHDNKQDNLIRNISSNLNKYSSNGIKENNNACIIDSRLREFSITNKEEQIINEISKGFTNKEIANNLDISLNTVRTHIQRIYKKSDVNNSVSLIQLFYNR